MDTTQVPAGYKLTDLGVLPEEWKVVSIGQIADVKGGKRLPLGKTLTNTLTPHPYVRIVDVYPGGISLDDIKYVPVDVFPAIKSYRIYSTDLFITVAGTLGIVGKVPKALNGANLTENADRLTNIKCDLDYLLSVMLSPIVQSAIDSEKTTGAQPKLALARIRTIQIPLPSPMEQQAIAAALGEMDALLAAQRARLAKQRAVKQGLLQGLLSGEKRLPGFAGEWEVKRLGAECELITKGTTPTSIGRSFQPQGINFIKIESLEKSGKLILEKVAYIDPQTHEMLKRSQLKENDILFSIAGALGRTALVPNTALPANTNQALAIIRLKSNAKLDRGYLFYFLTGNTITEHIAAINVQAAQANLSLLDISRFDILAPPLLEQQAIAAVLSEADAYLAALEAEHAKTQQLKQGLMQQLLTGKLRLV